MQGKTDQGNGRIPRRVDLMPGAARCCYFARSKAQPAQCLNEQQHRQGAQALRQRLVAGPAQVDLPLFMQCYLCGLIYAVSAG